MGVSIRAYGQIQHIHTHDTSDWEEVENHDGRVVKAYAYSSFPHAMEGLEGADQYMDDHASMLGGENYLVSDPYPQAVSRSYSGYGQLRRVICREALGVQPEVVWENPEKWLGEPYYDLIYFADNEGVLGPVACRRLADDWDSHPITFEVDPYAEISGSSYQKGYDTLGEMFHHAVDTGMVVFS